MKTEVWKPEGSIAKAIRGLSRIKYLTMKYKKLFPPLGIFLFTLFLSLHNPDGIALANPVPFDPFGFLDPLRMDLSLFNLAIAIPLAIIVEFIAVLCTIKLREITSSVSVPKMFVSVALINLITVPAAWFALQVILGVSPSSSAVPILFIELVVVGIEAAFYSKVFHLDARDAFWVAFLPNLASYIIGLIAYGYVEPYHSPFEGIDW
jgi:hypothetical protein